MHQHVQRRPRRTTRLAVIVTVAALLALSAPPAAASLSPSFSSVSSASAESTTTAPPTGGRSIEAETLAGGMRIESPDAHDGAFLRTLGTEARPALPEGFQEITVRAKGAEPTRLRITVNDKAVAAYTLTTEWTRVRAVAHVPANARIGLEAEVLPWVGTPRAIDLDWVHATGHEAALTTAANTIVDLAGGRTVPRGVTAPGYQAPPNVDGRLRLMSSMAREQYAWGATLVRIPLNQEHWLADCASVKEGVHLGYRDAVADEVDRLTRRGVVAMLTLTRTERGKATGCTPAAQPTFKEMADQRSPLFWRSVATRFASNPLVVFDLFNEPHRINDDVWHRGGTVTYTENIGGVRRQASYEAAGMQTLYDAVRAAGADNLVFVSGTGWAADPRALLRRPLSGYGIVAAVHTYCHGCSTPHLHPLLDTLVNEEVRSRLPVMITETGWIDSTSSSYNRQFLDWAAERGLGWTIYGWGHPKANYSLLLSWTPASFPVGDGEMTFRPAWAGTPVWNELADVRRSRGFDAVPLAESTESAGSDSGSGSDSGTVSEPDSGTGTGTGTESASFADVALGSTHAAAIDWLVGAGITTGCNADGTRYCPGDPVTRAQMATFLTRALDLPAGTTTFDDVRPDAPHAAGIAAVADAGITAGCGADGDRYCPGDPVTRAQMATFLTRALELPSGGTTFADVHHASSHVLGIAAVAGAGITTGCSSDGTRYCPSDPVTRAQMATFLQRAVAG